MIDYRPSCRKLIKMEAEEEKYRLEQLACLTVDYMR